METTGDARSDVPQDTGEAVSSKGRWPHLRGVLRRLAGGSAVEGPLGLLALQKERLAADRHLTTVDEAEP